MILKKAAPPWPRLLLVTTFLSSLSLSAGYDTNGVKKFYFGDTVGIDASGDSRSSCAFQQTQGSSTCCYSCACQEEPCACGPGLEKDQKYCDVIQTGVCREENYNVTKLDGNVCVLFLSKFQPSDVGHYQVTLEGDRKQQVSIYVQGAGSDQERIENGMLIKSALDSDISISATGRLDEGCKFLFTSKDNAKSCCYHTGELCKEDKHDKTCRNATNIVKIDIRRNKCNLKLTDATERDSGTYLVSFPAEYKNKAVQGYRDKKVEVEVSCETHGLKCYKDAHTFLQEARQYTIKCKRCVAFNITCKGSGVHSELCSMEATTYLDLRWDATFHNLEMTCYDPGNPLSSYAPGTNVWQVHHNLTKGTTEENCETNSTRVAMICIGAILCAISCLLAVVILVHKKKSQSILENREVNKCVEVFQTAKEKTLLPRSMKSSFSEEVEKEVARYKFQIKLLKRQLAEEKLKNGGVSICQPTPDTKPCQTKPPYVSLSQSNPDVSRLDRRSFRQKQVRIEVDKYKNHVGMLETELADEKRKNENLPLLSEECETPSNT